MNEIVHITIHAIHLSHRAVGRTEPHAAVEAVEAE
ncbi:hypothetical protein EVA_04194 [gut metagenome]|uniref:Uncharacterized protein n=1 Tax=gut metagenome TaxID=749906 RepID=J9GK62_9ZZZZ